ncbi:MAG: hypothetical protein HY897_15385 [Deltaproteobacteria bacterium]|nr:hypothetical protein [Deltaproteobacteria bacterium]
MTRMLVVVVAVIISVSAVWAAGCGATSACQDLYYKLCECEADKKSKDDCMAAVDKATFTADEDAACSEKKTSCTCDVLKNPEQAKTSCPENADIAGG